MTKAASKWADALPGDVVPLTGGTRLESIVTDRDFSVGHWSTSEEVLYCLCIGRVTSTTASGLTLLKVYVLTPQGIGYKRINLGGDKSYRSDALPSPCGTWKL